jgi:hypothetical protein
LLYPIDLPNDDAIRQVVKRALEALSLAFSDETVALDTTVASAARIVKLPGTFAAKGDSTGDRPHRFRGS